MSYPSQSGQQPSLGQLVGEIGGDLSKLMRQELVLAKAEIREEVTKAGKAGGMLGGAGLAGYAAALFGTLAAVFGLGHVMDLGWAALIFTGVWAVIGAALFVIGRSRLRQVSPRPEQTMETLKEDAQWARNLTR
jgi:hypothetical protein